MTLTKLTIINASTPKSVRKSRPASLKTIKTPCYPHIKRRFSIKHTESIDFSQNVGEPITLTEMCKMMGGHGEAFLLSDHFIVKQLKDTHQVEFAFLRSGSWEHYLFEL